MLPQNFVSFLVSLIGKTDAGEFKWSVDDLNSSISLRQPDFQIDVGYSFNEVRAIGQYYIHYRVSGDDTDYRLVTNQEAENEYELMQKLFNSAQGSTMKFPF